MHHRAALHSESHNSRTIRRGSCLLVFALIGTQYFHGVESHEQNDSKAFWLLRSSASFKARMIGVIGVVARRNLVNSLQTLESRLNVAKDNSNQGTKDPTAVEAQRAFDDILAETRNIIRGSTEGQALVEKLLSQGSSEENTSLLGKMLRSSIEQGGAKDQVSVDVLSNSHKEVGRISQQYEKCQGEQTIGIPCLTEAAVALGEVLGEAQQTVEPTESNDTTEQDTRIVVGRFRTFIQNLRNSVIGVQNLGSFSLSARDVLASLFNRNRRNLLESPKKTTARIAASEELKTEGVEGKEVVNKVLETIESLAQFNAELKQLSKGALGSSGDVKDEPSHSRRRLSQWNILQSSLSRSAPLRSLLQTHSRDGKSSGNERLTKLTNNAADARDVVVGASVLKFLRDTWKASRDITEITTRIAAQQLETVDSAGGNQRGGGLLIKNLPEETKSLLRQVATTAHSFGEFSRAALQLIRKHQGDQVRRRKLLQVQQESEPRIGSILQHNDPTWLLDSIALIPVPLDGPDTPTDKAFDPREGSADLRTGDEIWQAYQQNPFRFDSIVDPYGTDWESFGPMVDGGFSHRDDWGYWDRPQDPDFEIFLDQLIGESPPWEAGQYVNWLMSPYFDEWEGGSDEWRYDEYLNDSEWWDRQSLLVPKPPSFEFELQIGWLPDDPSRAAKENVVDLEIDLDAQKERKLSLHQRDNGDTFVSAAVVEEPPTVGPTPKNRGVHAQLATLIGICAGLFVALVSVGVWLIQRRLAAVEIVDDDLGLVDDFQDKSFCKDGSKKSGRTKADGKL
ncbi:hypothetical protein BSKO_10045 [Bryopsis sp. KO-2023]|nr:hypothetical protein BSKO_10045 [Bryopsis sp. KO-2023]